MDDRFTKLLVSHCADGASINTGRYNGACTQLRNDGREWLLIIHCSNHRLELAIADAYKTDVNFKDVDTFLLNVYTLFKNSGKLKSLLGTIALNLGVTSVSFIKNYGTRFQNHKYRAIKAALINLVKLYLLCENMIAGGSQVCRSSTTLATLKGYIILLQNTAHHFFIIHTHNFKVRY